ncbi:MAG: hypothetical protein LH472_12540 [Pyrinomonadaceae bacterium]|nr:hypothetical protein [Pyrinomonadaceae bacterium]
MIRELEQSEVKSPVVTQAVFNLNTKRFYWNLVNSETADSIVLHFFISDEKGTRYIDSVSAKSLIGEGELNSSPSYMKLGKFVVQTNLYFIPEYARTSTFYDSYHKSPKIKFDVRNAVPVTIDYGK